MTLVPFEVPLPCGPCTSTVARAPRATSTGRGLGCPGPQAGPGSARGQNRPCPGAWRPGTPEPRPQGLLGRGAPLAEAPLGPGRPARSSSSGFSLTAFGRAEGEISGEEVTALDALPDGVVDAFVDGALVDGGCGCGVAFVVRREGRVITRELSLTAEEAAALAGLDWLLGDVREQSMRLWNVLGEVLAFLAALSHVRPGTSLVVVHDDEGVRRLVPGTVAGPGPGGAAAGPRRSPDGPGERAGCGVPPPAQPPAPRTLRGVRGLPPGRGQAGLPGSQEGSGRRRRGRRAGPPEVISDERSLVRLHAGRAPPGA